jgi:hypothetical protein
MRQDGVAVFGAAIAALEEEAANLDRRAAAARALIQQLRDHAGVAAAMKVSPRQTHPASRKPDTAATGRQQAAKPAGRAQPAPGVSAAGTKVEAVAELKKLAAKVAKLDGLIKAEKNAATIKDHVAAMLRAECRGGEILVTLAGKVKDLPVTKQQRERWYRVAALAPKQFETELEYRAKLAIATLDGPQSKPSAPPKRPNLGPAPPVPKLTPWHTDETGTLTRELGTT